MGRVYDALKRAAAHSDQPAQAADQPQGPRPANAPAAAPHAAGKTNGKNGHAPTRPGPDFGEETLPAAPRPTPPDLFQRPSNYFNAPEAVPAAHGSASTEQPGQAAAGSALSGGPTARVAGATVDAVGSTHAVTCPSLEVVTARVEPHLVAITDPRTPHAEQYRSLRTRVLQAGERRRLQALVVTSTGVGEGKTVTALNLAWLLAQTDGIRAVLVDGDLRQPCAAEYLALDAPTGLSEVLAGEAQLANSLVRLEPAGLYLLPGGQARADCAELLSGPKFSAVLAELRRMFDYIIIDAPPLGIFTDAAVLIGRADAALVVVRANRTRFAALDRALEPLPRERILGVVLNGAQDDAAGKHGYYYQRRYYRRDTAASDAEEGQA